MGSSHVQKYNTIPHRHVRNEDFEKCYSVSPDVTYEKFFKKCFKAEFNQ